MLSDEDKYYLKQNISFVGLFVLTNMILITVMFPEVAESNFIKIIAIFGLNLLVIGLGYFLSEL